MNPYQMPCGCDPAYSSCSECNPPTCIGCSNVRPLVDDLCEACRTLAAELDADLERAAAAHAPRDPGQTKRIPIETMSQVVWGPLAPREYDKGYGPPPGAFTGGLNSCPHGRRPDQDCGACEGPAFDEGRE